MFPRKPNSTNVARKISIPKSTQNMDIVQYKNPFFVFPNQSKTDGVWSKIPSENSFPYQTLHAEIAVLLNPNCTRRQEASQVKRNALITQTNHKISPANDEELKFNDTDG